MHFGKTVFDFFSYLVRKLNILAASGLTVVYRALWDFAAEHLFETHSLTAKRNESDLLYFPRRACIRSGRKPFPFPTVKRHTAVVPAEFHNIALTGDSETRRTDIHRPVDQQISPRFMGFRLMRPLVHKPAVGGLVVFPPLHFRVYQSPLSSAEVEMLQAGYLQEIFLFIHLL